MAYRFSDTSKWDDEWFIDLSASEKLTFLYLCDNCDLGGFFELSMRKLSFDLSLTNEEVKASLKGLARGYILSADRRILFLKNFLKHQKNLPLNPENKAHKGILKRFENYKNRFEIDLIKLVENEVEIIEKSEVQGATEGLLSPTGIGNGKGISKEDSQKNKGVDFENFWNLYAKKVGNKKAVVKKWNKLSVDTQTKILAMLPKWKEQFSSNKYKPFPETFLNQERWNDEVTDMVDPVKTNTQPAQQKGGEAILKNMANVTLQA